MSFDREHVWGFIADCDDRAAGLEQEGGGERCGEACNLLVAAIEEVEKLREALASLVTALDLHFAQGGDPILVRHNVVETMDARENRGESRKAIRAEVRKASRLLQEPTP